MDQDKCLHCGESEPNYCEACYQELVAKNLHLQCEINTYRETLKQIYKEIEGK